MRSCTGRGSEPLVSSLPQPPDTVFCRRYPLPEARPKSLCKEDRRSFTSDDRPVPLRSQPREDAAFSRLCMLARCSRRILCRPFSASSAACSRFEEFLSSGASPFAAIATLLFFSSASFFFACPRFSAKEFSATAFSMISIAVESSFSLATATRAIVTSDLLFFFNEASNFLALAIFAASGALFIACSNMGIAALIDPDRRAS